MIVDREAQYTYLVYVILLGCLFMVFDIATSVLWHFLVGSTSNVAEIPNSTLILAIAAIACLGVFVILAAMVAANAVSNRIAGPVWRLNSNLKDLLRTGKTTPVKFRPKDQFHELAENYNLLMVEIERLQTELRLMRDSRTLLDSDMTETPDGGTTPTGPRVRK